MSDVQCSIVAVDTHSQISIHEGSQKLTSLLSDGYKIASVDMDGSTIVYTTLKVDTSELEDALKRSIDKFLGHMRDD